SDSVLHRQRRLRQKSMALSPACFARKPAEFPGNNGVPRATPPEFARIMADSREAVIRCPANSCACRTRTSSDAKATPPKIAGLVRGVFSPKNLQNSLEIMGLARTSPAEFARILADSRQAIIRSRALLKLGSQVCG